MCSLPDKAYYSAVRAGSCFVLATFHFFPLAQGKHNQLSQGAYTICCGMLFLLSARSVGATIMTLHRHSLSTLRSRLIVIFS